MTLAQVDQILDRGDDSSPQVVVDPKSPGQMGLTIGKSTSHSLNNRITASIFNPPVHIFSGIANNIALATYLASYMLHI